MNDIMMISITNFTLDGVFIGVVRILGKGFLLWVFWTLGEVNLHDSLTLLEVNKAFNDFGVDLFLSTEAFVIKFLVLGVPILYFFWCTEAAYFEGEGGILVGVGFLPIEDNNEEIAGLRLIIGCVTSSSVFGFDCNRTKYVNLITKRTK